ncbi:SRPBCC family protein [Streptosporangium vulgare]|uniref:SRPBCC family protein n=1 Tax=Streptosporangium vulgare TaxID=46190 RepID=UPI0031D86657
MAMRFEHEFTVPVPVDQAWPVLLDVERIAPCLPGAAVDKVEGDSFTGRMKMRIGPITVTYQGRAAFEKVDEDTRSMTVRASGKEARGPGTAGATVVARLHPDGRNTRVTVDTSFDVTGRPAQFGRGVMAEVGGKLIDRFAANLSRLLGRGPRRGDGRRDDLRDGRRGRLERAPAQGAGRRRSAISEYLGPTGPATRCRCGRLTRVHRPRGRVPRTRRVHRSRGFDRPPARRAPAPTASAFPGPAGSTGHGSEGHGSEGHEGGEDHGGREGREAARAWPRGAAGVRAGRSRWPGGPGRSRHPGWAGPSPQRGADAARSRRRRGGGVPPEPPGGHLAPSLSPDEEALNLLEVAGLPLLKRVAPLVAALTGIVLLAWLIRRALRR